MHNLSFEVDDCQVEWNRPPTDLVHLRNMSGLIDDWPFIYSQAYACLKPGGSIELLDFLGMREAAYGWFDRWPPDAAIHRLRQGVDEAGRITGRQFDAEHLTPELLGAAGFVDIVIEDDFVRLDPDEAVGQLWMLVCLLWMEAAYLRLLTSVLGWDAGETMDLIQRVMREMQGLMSDPAVQGEYAVRFRRARARKSPDAPWPVPHSAVASVHDEAPGSWEEPGGG